MESPGSPTSTSEVTSKRSPLEQAFWINRSAVRAQAKTSDEIHQAYLSGKVSLAQASSAAASMRKPDKDEKHDGTKCDVTHGTCCRPEDPPAVYAACKQKQVDEHAGEAEEIIPC